MTAEDFYHGEDAEITDFMQLTPTGIHTDYEAIFRFAEAYYKAKIESITDEIIKEEFPEINNPQNHSEHYESVFNHNHRRGIYWYKSQLLK